MPKTGTGDGIQGEGDYVAGRRFQEAEQAFVKQGRTAEKAREAADALKGPEGDDLEASRRIAAAGDIRAADRRRPRGAKAKAAETDRRVDEDLKETFPASDPAPASPGPD